MEFTIWSDSTQSDKNDVFDIHGMGNTDEFLGAINSATSPQKDSPAKLKAKTLSNDFNHEFDDFGDLIDMTSPWNVAPSEMGSGLIQDYQGLVWEDDLQFMGGNSSVERNNASGGISTFDDADGVKELLGEVDFCAIESVDSESNRHSNHIRDLSDTNTTSVTFVSPSHNDIGDGLGQNPSSINLSPEMLSDMMQTPIRGKFNDAGGQNQLLDRLLTGSPGFRISKLDSPLESPALQSPHLAYQPFPMLPTSSHAPNINSPLSISMPSHVRKFSNPASPKNRRKSSSASQSSMTSSLTFEAHEAHLQAKGPQTPRARVVSGLRNKHKNSTSSVTATPPSSSNSQAGEFKVGDFSPASALNTTPRNTVDPETSAQSSAVSQVNQNQTQTPTSAKEGKKDGRKRISKEQIDILEASFHQNSRPEREDRLRLAAETGLEQRTVQIWFQNRRAKSRSMKMPPSKADTSMPSMQLRAAIAAANNAVAISPGSAKFASKPYMMASPGMNFSQWGNTVIGNNNGFGLNPGMPPHLQQNNSSISAYNRTLSMTQMSPLANNLPNGGANFNIAQPFPARPSHQSWNSTSIPSSQPSMSYHQQLPKYGVHQGQPMNSPLRFHQVQQMNQMQQSQMERINFHQQPTKMNQMSPQVQGPYRGMSQAPGMMSKSIPAISPPRNRSSSSTKLETFTNYRDTPDSEYDQTLYKSSMPLNGRLVNRSDSAFSLASVNSGIPSSPRSADNIGVLGADMRNNYRSPQESNPAWQGPAPNHSLVSLSGSSGFDHTGVAPGSTDVKRRRSLYGTQASNWNAHYDESFAPSMTPSHLSPGNYSDSHSSGSSGSLAASAAAAALRTRNRSHTQPTLRSRQPSIRLQLDESNNTAHLVILSEDQDGTSPSSRFRNMPHEGHHGIPPGRAEPDIGASTKYGQLMQND